MWIIQFLPRYLFIFCFVWTNLILFVTSLQFVWRRPCFVAVSLSSWRNKRSPISSVASRWVQNVMYFDFMYWILRTLSLTCLCMECLCSMGRMWMLLTLPGKLPCIGQLFGAQFKWQSYCSRMGLVWNMPISMGIGCAAVTQYCLVYGSIVFIGDKMYINSYKYFHSTY